MNKDSICPVCSEELHDFKGHLVHGSSAMLERCLILRGKWATVSKQELDKPVNAQ